ncbi:MAG: hypothetical protein IJO74_04040 [Clostridia bacterium]|nr:hypothetical protein [Clostridia bacterium]
MNIITVCGSVVAIAVISAVIRKTAPDWSPLLSMCLGLLILGKAMDFIYPIVVYVKEIFFSSQYSIYLMPAVKALGIATVTHITCETCRDLNENSAAAKVELCGKAAILLCGIPIIKEIFATVNTLLS